MPTLRQKVDHFCKDSGAKLVVSDKLRGQVASLKAKLKKSMGTMKTHMEKMRARTKKVKVPKSPKVRKAAKAPQAPKAPKMKQEVQMMPLPAQAEPMMPAPAPSLAPAAPPKAGTRRRRMRR